MVAAFIRSRVEVVLVYQSLLGIYGDRGNAQVVVKRLAWRGYDAVLTVVDGQVVFQRR